MMYSWWPPACPRDRDGAVMASRTPLVAGSPGAPWLAGKACRGGCKASGIRPIIGHGPPRTHPHPAHAEVGATPVPIATLIERLECSRATVYRDDVGYLRDVLGAPVEQEEVAGVRYNAGKPSASSCPACG